MISIDKGHEPSSWTQHRLTPGARYEATPDLRNSLLKDQGYICAYCMRRIPVSDNDTSESTRIEHLKPQSDLSSKGAMDYANMVICCPGAMEGVEEDKTHCDRHKGNSECHCSPFNQDFINSLSYKSDGTIISSDPLCNVELNTILNLNIPLLKLNRKSVRDTVIRSLGSKDWKKRDLLNLLKRFSSKDKDGCMTPYCGVAISFIEKRLRQLQ